MFVLSALFGLIDKFDGQDNGENVLLSFPGDAGGGMPVETGVQGRPIYEWLCNNRNVKIDTDFDK